MEQWKEVDWITGYKGVLDVSNRGRIRRRAYSYETTGRWGTPHSASKPDKVLSPSNESHGYDVIAVQIDGRRKKFLVHRLVGRAFVPGYESGLTINHINGIKTDNRPENLEWVTLAINTKKQWETGLVAGVPKKLTSGKVRIIREALALGLSAYKLSILCDVDPTLIYGIRRGSRWKAVA